MAYRTTPPEDCSTRVMAARPINSLNNTNNPVALNNPYKPIESSNKPDSLIGLATHMVIIAL